MRNQTIYFCLTLVLGMLISTTAWANRLSATVDRDTLALNETVNLRVVFDGNQVSESPDFSGLSQNFEVLNNQRYSQQSIVNGQVSQSTEWRLTLAPKKTGQLLIPPFSVAGETSKALKIQVNEPAVNKQSGRQEVFIETSVEPAEGFVQQQFIVTYALHYSRNVDNLDMPDFQATNSRVESLPRVDYQTTIGQQTYGVSEFRYAVFPDGSGTLEIPGQTWTVRTTDQASINRFGFGGGRMKLHRAKTDSIMLSVLSKPDPYPTSHYWLPANEVTISQQWSRNLKDFTVGEPITRTVTLVANGASGEQLPPMFDDIQAQGFKFYPDKPKQDSEVTSQGVMGTRTESIAIVPTEPGELTLPELNVAWWNNETQEVEYASLDAVTVNVAGAVAGTPPKQSGTSTTSAPSEPQAATGTEPAEVTSTPLAWIITAILSLVSNLILISAIWHLRKQSNLTAAPATTAENHTAHQCLKELVKSCQAKSAHKTRLALLKWAEARFPNSPATLKTIAESANSDTLAEQLINLERHLFHDPQTPVDFERIRGEITALDKSVDAPRKPSLQPFYPSTSAPSNNR